MDALTLQLIGFVREIGLVVEFGIVTGATFTPGLTMRNGTLIVDEAGLRYPGDILHEAGHLAVVLPDRRHAMSHDAGDGPAEEMMAIAWSYAAARHIGIDPAVVFHAEGYRGGSPSLLGNFARGNYLAVPMLQWVGMACDPARAAARGVDPYPHMLRWLRPEPEAETGLGAGAERAGFPPGAEEL